MRQTNCWLTCSNQTFGSQQKSQMLWRRNSNQWCITMKTWSSQHSTTGWLQGLFHTTFWMKFQPHPGGGQEEEHGLVRELRFGPFSSRRFTPLRSKHSSIHTHCSHSPGLMPTCWNSTNFFPCQSISTSRQTF